MQRALGGMLALILAFSIQALGQERRDNDPNSATTSGTPTTAPGAGTTTGTTRTGTDHARDNRDEPGFDPGWLGLIGLAGLAGLLPKNRHDDRVHTDHNVKR